jgi:hypothetical protein
VVRRGELIWERRRVVEYGGAKVKAAFRAALQIGGGPLPHRGRKNRALRLGDETRGDFRQVNYGFTFAGGLAMFPALILTDVGN